MILASVALAASPGGFRLGPGVPTHMAGVRAVAAVDPDEREIYMAVPRAQFVVGRGRFDVELPVVVLNDGREAFTAVDLGQLRLGAKWGWRVREAYHAAGIELGVPVAPRSLRAYAWGSIARETVPAFDVMLAWEGAFFPDHPLVVRLAAGWEGGDVYGPQPRFEAALAQVVPVAGRFSLVGEAEALVDDTPVSARVLGRLDPSSRLSFDLGVQLPIVELVEEGPLVEVVGQVRGFF
ncbi:MAG: hypothetical protein ACOZNI_22105 [Myxococcota bacterium]